MPSRLSPISHLLWHRELACSRGCCDAEGSRNNSILQVAFTTSTISWLEGVSHSHQETSDKNLKPPAGREYPKTSQKESLAFRDFSIENQAGGGRKASGKHRADQHGAGAGMYTGLGTPSLIPNTKPQAANAPS